MRPFLYLNTNFLRTTGWRLHYIVTLHKQTFHDTFEQPIGVLVDRVVTAVHSALHGADAVGVQFGQFKFVRTHVNLSERERERKKERELELGKFCRDEEKIMKRGVLRFYFDFEIYKG